MAGVVQRPYRLTVFDQLKVEADPQLIQAVSAFNFGMGGIGTEHCGAFTGGILTLGVLLGRHDQGAWSIVDNTSQL